MENQIQSRQVGCCGARMWSLVIGWLQTIGSGLALLVTCGVFLGAKHVYKEAKAQEHENVSQEDKEAALMLLKIMGLAVFVTALISFAILFVSGIILILGVKQQNAGKLRIWYIVQIIFLVFCILGAVLSIFSGNYAEIVENILSVLLTIFCIWVVNIHRHELLSALPRGGSRKV